MTDKSPFFVETKTLTRLDDLREQLDRLESRLGGIEKAGLGGSAMELLDQLDQVYSLLLGLEQEGVVPPEESARFATIEAQLRQKAEIFLRAAGGPQGFQNARQDKKPDPQRWWWFIDQTLAAEKLQRGKRLGIQAVILVLVLVVLGVLYKAFLAPSPQDQARYEYESLAGNLISSGDLEGALEQIEKGLAAAPGSTELLVQKGVLQHALGRQAEAEQTFSEAQTAINDPKIFYLERGQDYLGVGDFAAARADAQAVIDLDPKSPEAHLLLGQAYELSGRYAEALETYEKTSSLASERDRPDISALARIRLAYLMQRIPSFTPYPSPGS